MRGRERERNNDVKPSDIFVNIQIIRIHGRKLNNFKVAKELSTAIFMKTIILAIGS